jgi:hypothetical protein
MRANAYVRAAIAAVIAVASAACNNVLGPTKHDDNWRVHDSAHFALHVRPGSFADTNAAQLAQILDDHFEHAVRVLGLNYTGRISAFCYTSQTDVEPHAPSNFSGVGFPETEAIGVVCLGPTDVNLAGLLTHEANHVIMGRGIGRHGTRFMNEGMASAVMSATHFPLLASEVHAWARRNASLMPPIRDLVDDDRFDDLAENVAYRTSASFLLYLLERYGASVVRELYTVRSDAFAARIQELSGRSLDALDAEWRAFVAGG